MPRQPRLDPSIELSVQLPETLVCELDFATWDWTRGKPKYGQRGQVIEALLRDFLRTIQPRTKPMPDDRPLPDLATLSDNDRIAWINDLRRRCNQGEEPSTEELNLAIEAIRLSRATAGRGNGGKKATVKPAQNEAFAGGLAGMLQRAGIQAQAEKPAATEPSKPAHPFAPREPSDADS